MKYDRSAFSKNLSQYDGIVMEDDANSDGTYPYIQYPHSSGNLNKQLFYSKNDHNFATWYQESTDDSTDIYKIVTCKLDHIRGNAEDDHCALFAAFVNTENGPVLATGMASINFQNDSDNNVVSGIITGDDIPDQIYQVLNDQVKDEDFSSSSEGRKSIPDIIRANFEAMENAIFPD